MRRRRWRVDAVSMQNRYGFDMVLIDEALLESESSTDAAMMHSDA